MSSKFYKSYFVLTMLFFSILLFIIAEIMVEHPTLRVEDQCELKKETVLKCEYSCKFYIDCEGEVNARIIALHFNWVAIYDNRTIFDCKKFNEINIELPKRDYTYILRTYFFNEEYGISEKVIKC